MNESNSLLITRLAAQILSRNVQSVNVIADDDTIGLEEKIDALHGMALAVNSPPPSPSIATTVATDDLAALVLKNNSTLISNDFQLRYNVLRMGVVFVKRYPKYYNETTADLVANIESALSEYQNYVNQGSYDNIEGYNSLLTKAEEFYDKIDLLFRNSINKIMNDAEAFENEQEAERLRAEEATANAVLERRQDDTFNNRADANIPTAFNEPPPGPSAPRYIYESSESDAYVETARRTAEIYTDQDKDYDTAYASTEYNVLVKTVLLKLTEKALANLQSRLRITTIDQLKKFRNNLNNDVDANDFQIFLNQDDCVILKNLSDLASKFFNVRCVADTLEMMLEAIRNNIELLQPENDAVRRIIIKMTQQIIDSNAPLYNIAMYKSDYDAIKNKNVKELLDLYNDRMPISFLDTSVASPPRKRSAPRSEKPTPTRLRPEFEVISSEDEREEDYEDIDYEKDRKRRNIEDEDYLKLKALEFSKDVVNEKLQKIIVVTDGMKRLYEYCNCKNSLETLPNAEDFASLLKKLNVYNLDHIEMSVNFYELMFPLTLYNDIDNNDKMLSHQLINYIFLASSYFQNCAKNFNYMRKTFNAYGPFKQIDFIVMFVIKFNFLCDMRNFAKVIDDLVPNKQPNMRIHSLLVMRDKVVKLAFNNLQFQIFSKKDKTRNTRHLQRLIMLMNANYNII
ncbi:vp80 protein [Thysanoplusia orichalcea nucleopolyhedrovirus]|uniref:Vp80 protein n=1 Tax=Thysanoplusia orichalcea nucleopolyhedrovirus TaxID=101850 RepID=L0CLE2_9ABAC|nr:vp80 protein [Thysanoplusia orichalcea nucleopolyhedrovirus]AGA16255.1 vp80 protein [Thysanoplusia orichalcea nucleopolyhedrovirus]